MSFDTTHICHLCGSGTDLVLGKCRRCKGDLRGAIAAHTLQSAYDRKPSRVSYVKGGVTSQDRPERIVALLEKLGVDFGKIHSFVDVGCGPNLLSKIIKERWPSVEVQGFDYDPRDTTEIKPIDLENAKLPYPDGAVDLVVCSHVLEHIDNNHALIDEILRIGKQVLLVLPNSLLWTSLAKVFLGRDLLPMVGLPLARPVDRHRWVYSVGELDRLMRHVAGKWNKELVVQYTTDYRLPTMAGRVSRDLFAVEASYLLR